ncbi:MAG: hypothetical protein J3Q66DRAFT_351202 [Benniella sp.]|nr:MAG: hypothetical protein J3Q66DRAFT_351202 [Benniella sp.]
MIPGLLLSSCESTTSFCNWLLRSYCSFSSRPKLSKTLLLSLGDINMICECPSCFRLYQGRAVDEERIMTMAAIMQATNEQTRTMAPYIDFMTVFDCDIWAIQFYNIPEDRSSLSICTKSSSSFYLGIHNAVLERCAPRIKSMLLAPFAHSPDMLLLASQMKSLRRLEWGPDFTSSGLENLTQFLTELQDQGTTPRTRGPTLEEFILPETFIPNDGVDSSDQQLVSRIDYGSGS